MHGWIKVFNHFYAAAPKIIAPPQSSSVLQGSIARLICNATSESTYTVTWLKNDYVINVTENAQNYSLSNNSSSSGLSLSSYLTIHNVTMADTANYTCTVTNIYGTQSATAYLEVQGMQKYFCSFEWVL